jgi:hypothetical protein
MNKFLLTIELVPKSSWMDNVRSVLTQSQWDIIKKSVYSEAWYICQICGGVGPNHPVEAHEIWTYNDKSLIQKLEGMIALCPNCHMVKHIGLAQINNKFDLAVQHFMKVNACSKKACLKYIKDSFKLWLERSNKKWTLDLSFLKKHGIDVTKIETSRSSADRTQTS